MQLSHHKHKQILHFKDYDKHIQSSYCKYKQIHKQNTSLKSKFKANSKSSNYSVESLITVIPAPPNSTCSSTADSTAGMVYR